MTCVDVVSGVAVADWINGIDVATEEMLGVCVGLWDVQAAKKPIKKARAQIRVGMVSRKRLFLSPQLKFADRIHMARGDTILFEEVHFLLLPCELEDTIDQL